MIGTAREFNMRTERAAEPLGGSADSALRCGGFFAVWLDGRPSLRFLPGERRLSPAIPEAVLSALAAAATEWNAAGREPSYLLSGGRLAQFEGWAAQTELALARISPNRLYAEALIALLQPEVRSLGLILPYQLEGAVMGSPLRLGQSLLLIWPQLTGLIATTILIFFPRTTRCSSPLGRACPGKRRALSLFRRSPTTWRSS